MTNKKYEDDKHKRMQIYNNYVDEITHKYQKEYGFEIGVGKHATWNNESDAFKHTFASADMAIRHGLLTSYIGGIYHEYSTHNNPSEEKNMDYWNNSKGKAIASELEKQYGDALKHMSKEQITNLIAPKVIEKMHKGELITNPSDKRKYTGFDEKVGDFFSNMRDKEYLNKSSNKVFTREDVRNMSKEEFKDNEDKIMKQVYAIGLPTKTEVMANEKKSKCLSSSHKDVSDGGS